MEKPGLHGDITVKAAERANVETWSGKGRKDENFPVGVIVAPHLRAHVHAFYSFARNADDIADSATLAAEDKIERLDVMESVLLGRSDEGAPSALALRQSLAETGVTSTHATELLIAFRQDARKSRYASWDELYTYCRYSAMPVGRHVLDLHGETKATWPASDALCAVLQVLNHLQDGAKDLKAMDRCYLPDDLMQRHGTGVDDLMQRQASPGLRRVIDDLLDHCDRLSDIGGALPRHVRDRRLRVETAIITHLARHLTSRLRRGDPVATRVKLTRGDVVMSVIASLRFLP
jgi:farnesyl-diphosphate farnesyltransferase